MIEGFVQKPVVDVIVPTYNNFDILVSMAYSFMKNTMTPYKMHIINNGDEIPYQSVKSDLVDIHNVGKNLGWMGGVNYGAGLGNAEYILMLNDDVHILDHDCGWLNKLLRMCARKEIGAVGPCSNKVMHHQQMMLQGLPIRFATNALSGFCMLTKRKLFEELGGLDESLSGGDDIDYSIRVRNAGYKTAVCRDAFVYHRGYVTGHRVYGNYYNSHDYRDRLTGDLIRKFGFKNWLHSLSGEVEQLVGYDLNRDQERDWLRKQVRGNSLDIGCGAAKVDERCIGVDVIPEGEFTYTPSQAGKKTEASILYDGKKLPFEDETVDSIISRHVFEHYLSPWKVLADWKRVLKVGGIAAVVMPDEDILGTVPLDPTHLHGYTKDSFISLVEMVGGFKINEKWNSEMGFSFGVVIEKL